MRHVYRTLAAVYEFAWKCGIVVIAVALLAAMTPGKGDGGLSPPTELDPMRTVTTTRGETVRVIMKAVDGAGVSTCMLLDDDGRQLLQATYDRYGCLNIQWGDAFPVRPFCSATRDGQISLVARNRMQCYELMLRPNGVSGVRIADYLKEDDRGLGYSRDGELVVDPWAIGLNSNEGRGSSARSD